MDGRTRNLFAVVVVAVAILAGGAALVFGGGTVNQSHQPVGPEPITGVIVAVDAVSLSDVRAITVRTATGELVDFQLDQLENGTEFPPGHLAEHQATAEPVEVWYRDEAGTLHAIRIEDAPR